MKKIILLLATLITVLALIGCQEQKQLEVLKGSISVEADIVYADVTVEIENEELLEDHNIKIVVAKNSTGKIVDSLDVKKGETTYRFIDLVQNTNYKAYIKVDNDIISEIENAQFTTKSSDKLELIGHLRLESHFDRVMVSLLFNYKDLNEDDELEIVLSAEGEEYRLPYDSETVAYNFYNLSPEKLYTANVNILKGNIVNNVQKSSIRTLVAPDIIGDILLRSVKFSEITIITNISEDLNSNETIILKDKLYNLVVDEIEYINGKVDYTFADLKYDTDYVIEIPVDDRNYINPLNVKTLEEPEVLNYLEGTIKSTSTIDSLVVNVDITNKDIIEDEIIKIALIDIETNKKEVVDYDKNTKMYVFQNLKENTNYYVKVLIQNSNNLSRKINNLEVSTLIDFTQDIRNVLKVDNLETEIANYNTILNNIKIFVDKNHEFDYVNMRSAFLTTINLSTSVELYNHFTQDEINLLHIEIFEILI